MQGQLDKILLLDCETSGLSEKTGKLLEIGAIFYSLSTQSIIHSAATLLHADANPVEHINNISVDSLISVNHTNAYYGVSYIKQLIMDADVLIAHNAQFDRKWLEAYPPLSCIIKAKRWICSRHDIKWPHTFNLKLETIAKTLEIDYSGSHRALGDCQILLSCLQKLDNLDEQLQKFSV
jgi:DNA polymerase-3 subunit epsilon